MASRRCNLRYAKKRNPTPKGVAQERKKSRRDERTVAVPYDVFKTRLSRGQQHE
jgi:hypothetical protein